MAKKIQFIEEDGWVAVKGAPYNKGFINRVKLIPGRTWESERKVWWVKKEYEAELRKEAEFYLDLEEEEEEEVEETEDKMEYIPPSNIMRYTDVVMDGVRSLLYNIKENNGVFSKRILEEHLREFKGLYCADSANLVSRCLGKGMLFVGKANEQQFAALLKMAMTREAHTIREIDREKNS